MCKGKTNTCWFFFLFSFLHLSLTDNRGERLGWSSICIVISGIKTLHGHWAWAWALSSHMQYRNVLGLVIYMLMVCNIVRQKCASTMHVK